MSAKRKDWLQKRHDEIVANVEEMALSRDSLVHAYGWRLAQLEDQWKRTKKARRAMGIATRALEANEPGQANLAVAVARKSLDGRGRA